MPFAGYGQNYEIKDMIAARRGDVATIATIEQGKADGRYRNGFRAIPTAHDDIIQGDAVGDKVNDGTTEYELKPLGTTGVLAWHVTTLSVAW